MGDSSPDTKHTLGQLAAASGVLERTIRSYIARGLLPPPEGRGRAATYGPEHLERLKFIQAVRGAAHPYELPLAKIEELLSSLPPERVGRIARGEEQVPSAVMGELDPSLLRRRRARAFEAQFIARSPVSEQAQLSAFESMTAKESVEFEPLPFARLESPVNSIAHVAGPRSPRVPQDDLWLGVDVTRDVRLSMRASNPQAHARLAELAQRLRGWLEGGGGA